MKCAPRPLPPSLPVPVVLALCRGFLRDKTMLPLTPPALPCCVAPCLLISSCSGAALHSPSLKVSALQRLAGGVSRAARCFQPQAPTRLTVALLEADKGAGAVA